MNAIRIRHCRLRVVRRGGWSWGANPRGLLNQVTQRLPRWLMETLAAQLADCAPDATIANLRVRVPVRLGELYAWPEASPVEPAAGDAAAGKLRAIEARLAEAVREAMPSVVHDGRIEKAVEAHASIDPGELAPTPVIDVMCAWHGEGTLARNLAAAGSGALAAWIDAVLAELDDAAQLRGVADSALTPGVARLSGLHAHGDPDPSAPVEALLAIMECLTAHAADVRAAETSANTGQPAPQARDEQVSLEAPSPASALRAARRSASRTRTPPPRQANRGPIPVTSVLPFVVTGVLSRLGYLDVLGAALVCAQLEEDAECFAAAITCKLALPPGRGWNRHPETTRLIAAVCGQEQAPSNGRTGQFLHGLSAVCSPLDASLRSRRCDPRAHAILVDEPEPGLWAAMDLAGAQPLGWFGARAALLTLAGSFAGRAWWLAPGAAHADLLDELCRRGARVVAMSAPDRAGQWLAISHELWSNDPALCRRGLWLRRAIDDARTALATAHTEFVVKRPLVIPACAAQRTAAEYSVTLAVTTALGTLAETLWRQREATTPMLALQRFGDLSGTVTFEEGRVLVRPALGRRFMDLNEHGLLRDITRVPWWPGRRVEFAGP